MEMPKSCEFCRLSYDTWKCDYSPNTKLMCAVLHREVRKYGGAKDEHCPLQEGKSESMENNKNCANCIYYKVDEINTVDKSNPRAFCYALPSTTLIRHRVTPCIYYKEKDN